MIEKSIKKKTQFVLICFVLFGFCLDFFGLFFWILFGFFWIVFWILFGFFWIVFWIVFGFFWIVFWIFLDLFGIFVKFVFCLDLFGFSWISNGFQLDSFNERWRSDKPEKKKTKTKKKRKKSKTKSKIPFVFFDFNSIPKSNRIEIKKNQNKIEKIEEKTFFVFFLTLKTNHDNHVYKILWRLLPSDPKPTPCFCQVSVYSHLPPNMPTSLPSSCHVAIHAHWELPALPGFALATGQQVVDCPCLLVKPKIWNPNQFFWDTAQWFIDHFEAESTWRGAINTRIGGPPNFWNSDSRQAQNGIWIQTLSKMGCSPAQMMVPSLVFISFQWDIYQPPMRAGYTRTKTWFFCVRHVLYFEFYTLMYGNSPRFTRDLIWSPLHLRFCPTGGNSERAADLRRSQDQWCHSRAWHKPWLYFPSWPRNHVISRWSPRIVPKKTGEWSSTPQISKCFTAMFRPVGDFGGPFSESWHLAQMGF